MLGHPFFERAGEHAGIDLQHEVDDIILRARKGNIEHLDLNDLAGELNKSVGIYIDPANEEFRQRLMDVLQQNDWVREVSPTGQIVIKSAEEFQPEQGQEPGEEIKMGQEEQEKKVQKIASKNVKDKGGEL